MTVGRRIAEWATLGGLVALALVPIAAATARVGRSWVAVSDQAGIVLRSRDVFTGETPLIGMPTTLSDALGTVVHHPGPAWFWPSALGQAIVDHHATPMFATVALNGAAVVAIVVLARRIGGWPVATLAAGLVAASCWSLHDEMLTDPYNPYAGHLLLGAFFVAVVAVGRGVPSAIPVAVVTGSVAVQAHVSLLAPVGGALVVLAVCGYVQLRSHGGGLSGAVRRERGVALLAALVVLVAWSPVVIDLIAGRHNLWNLMRASTADGEALGISGSARVLARAVAEPAWLSDERTVAEVLAPVAPITWVVALLVVVAAIVSAWRWRRTQPAVALTIVVTLGALVAGGVAMARIPVGFWTLYTLHNYLWLWATTAVLAGALLVGLATSIVGRVHRHGGDARSDLVRRGAFVFALVPLVVFAGLSLAQPIGRPTWSSEYGPAILELASGGGASLDPGSTYELVIPPTPLDSIVPLGLLVELERAGIDIRVADRLADMVGEHRVVDGRVAGRLILSSGPEPPASIAGARRIATAEGNPAAIDRLDRSRQAVVDWIERGGGLALDDPVWADVSSEEMVALVESGALISYWELGLIRTPAIPDDLMVELRRAHHAPVTSYALDVVEEGDEG